MIENTLKIFALVGQEAKNDGLFGSKMIQIFLIVGQFADQYIFKIKNKSDKNVLM